MLAKTLRIMAVLFSVVAYAVVNVRVGSEICEITVNMNRPLWIELPCQILPVGTDGTRGLWIAPKSGRGWKGEAGGLARYRFWAPRSGKYTVWGYCYWNDACTNAVFVKVDQMARAILGNDPIFAEWHWIRGFDLYLEQGPHLLELSNHSDGIAVLRVLLTTDDLKTPEGAGSVSADLFYDDFNGCDNGNFARWRTIRGQWSVLHCGDKTKPEENFLQGRADTDALLVFDSQSWSGYRFNVLIGPVQGEQPQSAAGVCFGLQSPDNYYRLQWARAGADGPVQFRLLRVVGNSTEDLGSYVSGWDASQWHDIEMVVRGQQATIRVDAAELGQVNLPEAVAGGIGLWVEGPGSGVFDNVRVQAVEASVKIPGR